VLAVYISSPGTAWWVAVADRSLSSVPRLNCQIAVITAKPTSRTTAPKTIFLERTALSQPA
jgi:hypothetical protein